MTNPPPRKRFQIHLSTAIVMMFVAGALIWANVYARVFYSASTQYVNDRMNSADELRLVLDRYYEHLERSKDPDDLFKSEKLWDTSVWIIKNTEQGWPCTVSSSTVYLGYYWANGLKPIRPAETFWRGAIVNAITAMIVICSVGFFFERLIHHRAAEKGG